MLCSISAAAELANLLQGPLKRRHLLELHGRIFRIGTHQDDLLATRLIGRYPPQFSSRLLRLLRRPGIFPFNAAIRVLADSGDSFAAFSLFNSLRCRSSIPPNSFTFSFLLKACSLYPSRVRQLHAQMFKYVLDGDPALCNSLLAAYCKGDFSDALKLFDEMFERRFLSISGWSSIIRGLSRQDKPDKALFLFLRMLDEGLSPQDETMVAVLSACSKIRDTEFWVDLLQNSGQRELENDSIDIVLVYLYAKSGELERSKEIFNSVIQRSRASKKKTSIVLWNCMISGHPAEAIGLFRLLTSSSYHPRPNHVTIAAVLPACAELGDLELGRKLHQFMATDGRKKILPRNSILATAFVDMYSKCGSPDEAMRVFREMEKKDVVAFNAMITGLAVNGRGVAAVELFEEMRKLRLRPNDGSFVAALSACTHAGLVDEGRRLFEEILQPGPEHYACYVDLLARAGHMEAAAKAYVVAAKEPNERAWGALIGACLGNSGEEAVREMAETAPAVAGGYVMLSNAAAVGGRWTEVESMRKAMVEKGFKKQPGRSWITINGVTRQFLVGSLTEMIGLEDRCFLEILESLHSELSELSWH